MSFNSGGNGPWGPSSGGGGNPWGGKKRPGSGPSSRPSFDAYLSSLLGRLGALGAWLQKRGAGEPPGLRWGVIGVAILIVLWLASGFYVVNPDQEGVVLRFGAYSYTTRPGLNYHLPWPIETALLPDVTRIHHINIGYNSGPAQTVSATGREIAPRGQMLTGDENIVDLNFAVFWRISNVKDYLFNVRHPGLAIRAVASSVMREVIGANPIEPVLTTARARIEQAVQAKTQTILDQYGAGVAVTEVQLLTVDPPPQVIDSFRDVQRANTDAESMVNTADAYRNNVVPRARGEAAQIVARAEGEKAATIAKATGEAKQFLSVLASYDKAKDITLRRLYIETMQDILEKAHVTILPANVQGTLPFLPLSSANSGKAEPQKAVQAPVSQSEANP